MQSEQEYEQASRTSRGCESVCRRVRNYTSTTTTSCRVKERQNLAIKSQVSAGKLSLKLLQSATNDIQHGRTLKINEGSKLQNGIYWNKYLYREIFQALRIKYWIFFTAVQKRSFRKAKRVLHYFSLLPTRDASVYRAEKLFVDRYKYQKLYKLEIIFIEIYQLKNKN